MLKLRFEPLNLQIDRKALAQGIFEAARDVAVFFDSRDIAAADLMPIPPRRVWPRDYPLEWTRQEAAEYWRKVRAGQTTFPYQRTGNLFSAWEIKATQEPDGATVSAINPTPYAADVVGTFSDRNKQKRYHNITGWAPVAETVNVYADRLTNSIQEELQVTLQTGVLVVKE